MRSPFAPVCLPLAALIGALVRWQMQGSRNMWTAFDKRFYVPDPDLGWRVVSTHAFWLGLEACAVIAAVAIGLVAAGWIIRRREARLGRRATGLRAASWVIGGLPLAAPILAFASGSAPANAVDALPASTIRGIEAGIVGTLDAPGGRYEIIEHAGTSVIAHLSAGKETFDVRFGGVGGTWQGDPHDLTQPIAATIGVDATTVDTGIDLRTTHAREEYLHVDKFPRITVALDRVLAASPSGAGAIAFRAHGTLGLIGKTHAIEVTGTMKKPDAAALTRLGLSGEILLVQADFSIAIKESALAGDAGDFDGDQIPIHVSLVMRHTSG